MFGTPAGGRQGKQPSLMLEQTDRHRRTRIPPVFYHFTSGTLVLVLFGKKNQIEKHQPILFAFILASKKIEPVFPVESYRPLVVLGIKCNKSTAGFVAVQKRSLDVIHQFGTDALTLMFLVYRETADLDSGITSVVFSERDDFDDFLEAAVCSIFRPDAVVQHAEVGYGLVRILKNVGYSQQLLCMIFGIVKQKTVEFLVGTIKRLYDGIGREAYEGGVFNQASIWS